MATFPFRGLASGAELGTRGRCLGTTVASPNLPEIASAPGSPGVSRSVERYLAFTVSNLFGRLQQNMHGATDPAGRKAGLPPSSRGAPRTGLPASTYPARYYERHVAWRTPSAALVLPEMPIPRRRLDRNPASEPPMPRRRNSSHLAELSHWATHPTAPGIGGKYLGLGGPPRTPRAPVREQPILPRRTS